MLLYPTTTPLGTPPANSTTSNAVAARSTAALKAQEKETKGGLVIVGEKKKVKALGERMDPTTTSTAPVTDSLGKLPPPALGLHSSFSLENDQQNQKKTKPKASNMEDVTLETETEVVVALSKTKTTKKQQPPAEKAKTTTTSVKKKNPPPKSKATATATPKNTEEHKKTTKASSAKKEVKPNNRGSCTNKESEAEAVPDKKQSMVATTKTKSDEQTSAVAAPTTTTVEEKQSPPKNHQKDKDDDDDSSSSSEPRQGSSTDDDAVACCLCHCGLDCSDRGLFFREDRQRELQDDENNAYYFNSMDDPYIDEELYDRNNALVYCDSCERLYHQKCHFVPLLVLPRGDWECLVCSQQQKWQNVNSTKDEAGKLLYPTQVLAKMFTTPPQPNMEQLQTTWEWHSRATKAALWNQQLKQIKSSILGTQFSNIRQAQATLATLLSTKRNRQHLFTNQGKNGKTQRSTSQELAQTIWRLTSAKFKIREVLQSLESIRTAPQPGLNNDKEGAKDKRLLQHWCQEHTQHAHHVFPYGPELYETSRRCIPRTREMKMIEEKEPTIPTEISISVSLDVKQSKTTITTTTTNGDKKTSSSPGKKNDDDSGITLDDLQCCVCFIGDSSDENDVLLCDGQGCYRAFHMKCIQPEVKVEDIANEDEDWFCPLCSCISNMIHDVQCNFMDDQDWEERRAMGDDSSSLKSWDHVEQVFPEANWEYEAAVQLKKGKQNEDTQKLLAVFLGEDVLDPNKHHQTERVVGSDDEDENDYSLFDENSFEDRRRKERRQEEEANEDDNASESTRSSQASLVDMSSVELSIGHEELAALSDVVQDDSSDNSEQDTGGGDDTGGVRRKSRRLRHVGNQIEQKSGEVVLGADFDEANILPGKRRRKTVDYRKLNDALFGELSEKQRAQIDDAEDFKAKSTRPKKRKRVVQAKEESSDDEKDDGSEEGSDNQGGDSECKNDENSNDDLDSADSDGSDGSDSDDQEGSEDESNGEDDTSGSESEKEESNGKPKSAKPYNEKETAPTKKKTNSASTGTLALKGKPAAKTQSKKKKN